MIRRRHVSFLTQLLVFIFSHLGWEAFPETAATLRFTAALSNVNATVYTQQINIFKMYGVGVGGSRWCL